MRKTTLAIGLAMAVATAAYATPGYGPGYGQGYGPGNGPCATAGAADCPGACAGYGMGRGRMGGMGPGGQGGLMTEQERDAHREKMGFDPPRLHQDSTPNHDRLGVFACPIGSHRAGVRTCSIARDGRARGKPCKAPGRHAAASSTTRDQQPPPARVPAS